MSVSIMIQFNGKNLTIPINPEQISPTRSAENTTIDIIGIGKSTRKGEPSLKKISIESFFPGQNSYYYTGVLPKTCIEFIEEIWYAENTNNNVAKIVTLGLPIDLNMYFVIDSFIYDYKAGEEEDIYYKLEITEYRPYGVKTVDIDLSGLAAARATSTAVQNPPVSSQSANNTYTVVKGDCLFNIAKACTGNGNNWRALYDLNKAVIGKNPNLIYPRTSIDFASRLGSTSESCEIKKST